MYFIFNRYLSARALAMWISELSLVMVVSMLVVPAVFSFLTIANLPYSQVFLNSLLMALTYILTFYFFDLYTYQLYKLGWQMIARLIMAILSGTIILLVYCNITHPSANFLCWGNFYETPSGPSCFLFAGTLIFMVIFPLLLVLWRTLFAGLLSIDFPEKRVMILGSGDLAKKIGNEIYNRKEEGFRLLGYVADDPEKLGEVKANPGVIGGYADITDLAKQEKIDEIIVALSERRAKLPMSALLDCKLAGVSIIEGETFKERMTGKIPLDQLKPSWLVFSDGFRSLKSRKILKHVFDFAVSIFGLLIALPIMFLTAIIIKLESRGPVLFSQIRMGENGKEFELYKFRSMRQDAEEDTGPVWAKSGDDRVTRVGRFIRKTRIDELPQLINVLKGDMSFVGPRPERPFFINKLKKEVPYYEVRLVVKPGITGWAQVKYPYGASVKDALEKLQFDLYYIKNMSPLLDLLIVFLTFKVVLKGSGAR